MVSWFGIVTEVVFEFLAGVGVGAELRSEGGIV